MALVQRERILILAKTYPSSSATLGRMAGLTNRIVILAAIPVSNHNPGSLTR
jgi:hypothetical protein